MNNVNLIIFVALLTINVAILIRYETKKGTEKMFDKEIKPEKISGICRCILTNRIIDDKGEI